jgi:hypothetical protein
MSRICVSGFDVCVFPADQREKESKDVPCVSPMGSKGLQEPFTYLDGSDLSLLVNSKDRPR